MRKFALVPVLCGSLFSAKACDICGCSAGNYFIGPFPQFTKHFIGARYSFRRYKSVVADDQSEFSQDHYQTYEIWGGMKIGKRWQLLGFFPYNTNSQRSDEGSKHSHGIGDITLLANYKLLDKRSMLHDNLFSQQLSIGAGVKIPTGKFSPDPDDIIPGANNQPGTGSTDFIANLMHSMHYGDCGLNTVVNFKYNSEAKSFRFGNRINIATNIFKTFRVSSLSVAPNAGLSFEKGWANKLNNEEIPSTGGSALFASAGVEVGKGHYVFGVNMQLPVSQHLSDGQTDAKVRGLMHVTYTF